MKHAAAALVLAMLASCTTPVGGSGVTADGRPLASTMTFSNDISSMTATIVSPDGWTCTSRRDYRPDKGPASGTIITQMIIQVPISCSDGVAGTSLWTYANNPFTITISFSLPRGRTGSVRHQFGR